MSTSVALFIGALFLGMAGLTARNDGTAAVCLGAAILSAILAFVSLPLPA